MRAADEAREVERNLSDLATKLENRAIETAEASLNHNDWPLESRSKIAHAELKLRCAELLRKRARDKGRML